MPLYHHIEELPAGFMPRRMVSLVPSQTEWLYALGLEEEVVGITKFCIHPNHWFRQKTRVGGTKTVDMEKVAALSPDLVIANKEENIEGQVLALAEKYPVWLTDVNTVKEALMMMKDLAAITGKQKIGAVLLQEIENSLATWQPLGENKSALYLIWREPFMAAGDDTFIHSMLETMGLKNVLTGKKRYPELSPEELISLAPDYILLSSEPYPFKQKHLDEISEWLPHSKVLLVDGEIFSWYGSRMLHAVPYFRALAEQL